PQPSLDQLQAHLFGHSPRQLVPTPVPFFAPTPGQFLGQTPGQRICPVSAAGCLNVSTDHLGTFALLIGQPPPNLAFGTPTVVNPPTLPPQPFGDKLPSAASGPPQTDLGSIFAAVPQIRDIPTKNVAWSYLGP